MLIPPAVWREVVIEGRNRPGVSELKEAVEAGWVEIVEPSDRNLVRLLRRDLDEGEAEAIALALEKKVEVVFLDETEPGALPRFWGYPGPAWWACC